MICKFSGFVFFGMFPCYMHPYIIFYYYNLFSFVELFVFPLLYYYFILRSMPWTDLIVAGTICKSPNFVNILRNIRSLNQTSCIFFYIDLILFVLFLLGIQMCWRPYCLHSNCLGLLNYVTCFTGSVNMVSVSYLETTTCQWTWLDGDRIRNMPS